MWKKAVPAVALCSVLLVGCGNNNDNDNVPSDNETPVEDVNNGNDVNTTNPANNDAMNENGASGAEGSGNNGMGTGAGVDDAIEDIGDTMNGNNNNTNDNNTINNNGDGVMDETNVKEPRAKNGGSNQ